MKTKRYVAESMRRALEMVREEQGSDVMILSNRRVEGGVELITATEDDLVQTAREASDAKAKGRAVGIVDGRAAQGEGARLWTDPGVTERMQRELATLRALVERQLSGIAWRDFDHEHPIQAAVVRDLNRLGLNARYARRVAALAGDHDDYSVAWRRTLGVLAHEFSVTAQAFLETGGRVAVLGPPGSGKTSVIAKCAAQYSLRHGANSVLMISTDDVRIGGQQELKAYGRILGVPVRCAHSPEALQEVLAGAQRYRLVLIDTPGLAPGDPRMQGCVELLASRQFGIEPQLVVPATTDYRTLAALVTDYSGRLRRTPEGQPAAADVSLILTKLDLAAQLGGVISVAAEQQLPVAYVSAGTRIPDDLERAQPHRIVIRAVQMAKLGGDIAADSLELEQAFSC